MGDVHVDKAHRLAADLSPGLETLANAGDWGEGLDLQIDVDLAAAEVVNDQNIVALIGQIHSTGPAAKAVTTKDQDLHDCLLTNGAKLPSGQATTGFRSFS